MTAHPHLVRRQRGLAALVVTLLLFLAMVLAALFVNRHLMFEQRSATNQYRASQAFEAAEAGLEWALAQLNNPRRIGADCLDVAMPPGASAGTSAAAVAFRNRYLQIDAHSGRIAPVAWTAGAASQPLRPSCIRGDTGWVCSCPSDAAPALPAIASASTTPAFSIEFAAAPRPGVVRVVSFGCTRPAPGCDGNDAATPEANARVEAAVALVPALRTPPPAALTARGAVITHAALGIHNSDPESGIAIDAGGTIAVPAARLTTPAGAGPVAAWVANDAALAATPSAQLFAQLFGIGKTHWQSQPVVARIDCGTDAATGCTTALQRALDATDVPPLVWIDGDLALTGPLTGPLTIASPERPAIVIATGTVRLSGDIRFHGVLYGNTSSWDRTSAAGALLRGALISESDHGGDGTPSLFYDRQVLTTLQHASGSFVRVGGSWRDF